MKNIEQLSPDEARALRGLLFDLDDTLLDGGKLSEAAYSALFRLREARLDLIAVTGRPAGWGAVLARQWPVDGVVTENGAIALLRHGDAVQRMDRASEHERHQRRIRLGGLVASMQEQFPSLTAADDVDARISDFAFDIGERRRVPRDVVEAAARFAGERGARTTASSVHLHVSFETDDKASGTLRLLRTVKGIDATTARFVYAFIGDSENDAACFAAFHTTIGVKNLSGRPTVPPRWITGQPRGAGFAEAARVLVELRRGPVPMG